MYYYDFNAVSGSQPVDHSPGLPVAQADHSPGLPVASISLYFVTLIFFATPNVV